MQTKRRRRGAPTKPNIPDLIVATNRLGDLAQPGARVGNSEKAPPAEHRRLVLSRPQQEHRKCPRTSPSLLCSPAQPQPRPSPALHPPPAPWTTLPPREANFDQRTHFRAGRAEGRTRSCGRGRRRRGNCCRFCDLCGRSAAAGSWRGPGQTTTSAVPELDADRPSFLLPSLSLPSPPSHSSKMARGKAGNPERKQRSALHDVVAREYTIHLHTKVHGHGFKHVRPPTPRSRAACEAGELTRSEGVV